MAQGFDISNITNSKLLALAKEVDEKNMLLHFFTKRFKQ